MGASAGEGRMAEVLVLLTHGSLSLALTEQELSQAVLRARSLPVAREAAGDVSGPEPVAEPLLDAEGVEAATGVAASWWAGAARRGEVPHYRIGRWIRFRLSELLDAAPRHGRARIVGPADRESAAPPRKGRKKATATAQLQARRSTETGGGCGRDGK